MKIFQILIFVTLIGLGPLIAWSDESRLSILVHEALTNNLELQAAKAKAERYQHRVSQAKSLDDPMLSFSFSNYPHDSFNRGEYPMTGDELRIAQKFPFPGKLAAKEAMAEGEAGWYEAVYRDSRQQIARKVKDVWYRLYYLDRSLDVTNRNLALLDDVIRLAEVRYETGQGLQKDVLNAHLQRSRLLDKRLALVHDRQVALAELNTLLDRPANDSHTPPESLTEEFNELDIELYLDAARKKRPMHLAYQSLLDRSRQQQQLAGLDDYPDLTVWAGWRFRDGGLPDDGTDFVSAGLSINLPIYREKRVAAKAEAGAALRTVQKEYAEFRNQVERTIRDAYSRMVQNRDQTKLYRQGIIPQSSQTYSAMMSAYQVGKVSFTDVLEALISLYNDELAYHQAYSSYLRNLALLEAEAGLLVQGDMNAQGENMAAQIIETEGLAGTRKP